MRREIIPDMVSDFLTFPASPFENWGRSHGILASDSPNTSPYFGQISQDGAWIWETRGPLLEVFSTSRCERCSSWCFGAILKDTSVVISAVTELPSSGNSAPKLLVGVEYASSGNLLCLFDIKTSKVVKAVEVNAKITSLAVISSKGGVCMETRPIYQELRCMFGLVAVGTLGGQVLLLDLNLDDENHSDELTPNQAVMITQQMHNIPERREKNIKHNKHLCLLLNDDSFQRGAFLYKSEDNSPIHNFIVDDALYVSSIEYLKPLTALVVGFSFGGFQIWNMRKMALEFSSFLESGLSPVVKVAFQEPENDPRNYCYLWIVHGQPVFEKQRPQKVAVASMFSVTYRNKDWLDGYGCLYQDFQTCSLRFQCPLTLDPYYSDLGHSPENKNNTSRLVSCQTIQQSNIWGPERHEREDSLQNSDWDDIQELSLCVLVWEAWFDVADTNSHCIMLIFDINQWYQAQMPSSFRISSGKFSSYVEIFSLTKVLEEADRGSFLLDVHIVPSSLMKFNSKSSVEQFYFPSSLGFKLYCVTENGIMQLSFLGIQRQILSKMVTNGPSILVNPQSLYSMCLKAGLVSHHQELDDVSISAQREAVLSVALEYNLSHFFAACINQWASSDDHSGCTLRFLCNWAWKKVTQIKTSSDRLLVPFFNCSGQEVDKATLNLLQSYSNQLNHLACLIHLLQSRCGSITQQGQVELELRCEVTEIVALYLKVTLWMFTCRLLPEHSEGTAYGENEVAYPVKIFTDTYTRRRQELQKLHSTVNHIDILLVDGLVLEIESFLDQHLWQREGGNGQYPPPSLYAALSSYLLKGVPVDKKHCLILYLLLDMAAFLSERQSHLVEHLMKFSATFHVNPSLVKLTQGFWLLDHRDFEEALSALLDPVIDLSDFKSWHHLRILKAFLYQGEHQKALKYTRVRNPPHETPEEVKLCLTILLANKLTAEAFHFQRQCRDQKNMDDFLSHFFLGCQQTLVLDSLLQLPLSVAEEEALVQFLYNSNDPKTKEMLVMYFLQRCRPLQAAQLNEKVYPHLMESDSFSHKEKSKARNALVQGYLSSLPEAQNRLASEFSLHQHQRLNKRQEVLRPFPLSTVVSTKLLPVVSHSTLFESLMKKVTEADLCGFQEPITPFRKSSREKINLVVDDVPFVCTPLTPRKSRTNRMSEIIYPTSVSKDTLKRSADHYDTQGSPKKSRLVEMSPFKLTYLDRRKSIKHLGSEVLSLLQTPPISRKPVSPKDQILASTGSTPAITPSSILKVRQLLHKTGSSPAIGNDDQDEEKGVTEECDAEDMEVVRPIPDDEEEEEDVSRHLRFMVPKARSLTPPYQECWPSTPPPRLSPRTLRDRSPTPERPSTPPPRWSPRTLRDRSPTPERPSTPPPRLSSRYVRDRSSTPDRSSLKDYRASPRRPLRQTSIISPYSEAYSPCADLLVEDEDITLNFSVQKKREVSHIDKKGMLSSRSPLEKPSTSSVCRRTPCVANEHLIGQALLSPSHETSHQFITTEDIIETKALSTIHEVTESTSIHKTSLEEHSAQIEANFIPIEVTESVDLLTDKNLSIENTLTSHKAIHQASSIEKVETFKSEQSFSEKSPIYFRSVKGDKSSFTKTPDQTPESVLDSVQKAEVLVTPPKTSIEEQKVTVEPSNTSVDSGESERFLTSANTPLKIVRNLLGSSLTSVETPLKVGFSSTPTEILVQERKDVLRFSETTVETPVKVGFSVIPSEILVQEGKGLSGPSVTDANTFSETSDTSEKLNYSEAPTEVPCPGKKYLMEPSYVFTGMQEEITADEMKVSLEPFFVTKEIPDHEKKLSLESSGTIWETPEETPDYEMKVSLKSSVTTREISDNEKKISQGSSGTIREIPVETPDKETKLSLEFTSTVRETTEKTPDKEIKVLLESSATIRETPEESPDYEMKVSPEPSGSTGETPGYEMKVLLDSSGITRETPEESPDYKKKVSPEPSGSTGETPGYEMKVLLESSGTTRDTPEELPDGEMKVSLEPPGTIRETSGYEMKVSLEPSGSTGETPGYEMKISLQSSGTTRETPEELPDDEMKLSLEPLGTIRETPSYEMEVSLEPSCTTRKSLEKTPDYEMKVLQEPSDTVRETPEEKLKFPKEPVLITLVPVNMEKDDKSERELVIENNDECMLFLSDSESEHEEVGTTAKISSGEDKQEVPFEENISSDKLDKKEDKTPIRVPMTETLSKSLKTVEEEKNKIELDVFQNKSSKLETSPILPGSGSLEDNVEPPSSETAECSGKLQSPQNQHILIQTGSSDSQQTHTKGFETPISKLSTAKRTSTRKKRMLVEEHEPPQTVRSTRSRISKSGTDGTISESSVDNMKTQKSGSSGSSRLSEKTQSPGTTAKGSTLTTEELKEHKRNMLEEEDSPKTRSRISSQKQKETLVSPVKIVQENSTQPDIKKEHILDSLSSIPFTTYTPGVVTRAERRRRESTTSEDSERYADPAGYPKFTFTEPTVPEESEVLDLPPFDTSKTSAMSFIFSPPITRSRTRRRRSEDVGSDIESYTPPRRQLRDPLLSDSPTSVTSTDLDMASQTQAVEITTKTKETKRKTRSKKGKPPAHSIINLISPVPEESSVATASSSRGPKKTGTQAKHTMTLRKAKLQSRRRVKL